MECENVSNVSITNMKINRIQNEIELVHKYTFILFENKIK